MWIAKQAVQCALPPNWVEAEDEEGNAFFHNTSTGQSQAKHPMDDYFGALVVEERDKLPRRRAALVAKSKGRRRGTSSALTPPPRVIITRRPPSLDTVSKAPLPIND